MIVLLILTMLQVGQLSPLSTLNPIMITAGPYAGQYAVGPCARAGDVTTCNVVNDPAQMADWTVLSQGQSVSLDPAVAWPDTGD